MNHVRALLLTVCSIVAPISAATVVTPAVEADPSDVTRSSYATPVRGDVIEWEVHRDTSILSVTFDPGSAVLVPAARVALADSVAHGGREMRAEVTGRTDPDGGPALGVARAASLRRALIAAGLSSGRVVVVAEGRRADADSTRYEDSTVRFVGDESHVVSPRGGGVIVTPPAQAASSPLPITAASPPPIPTWEVQPQDITLARTLERWAATAGYKLRWDADRNFLIAATDRYEGTFESALQALLGSAGIRHSDYPLEACIYANRPPLVRITRLGEQARECEAP